MTLPSIEFPCPVLRIRVVCSSQGEFTVRKTISVPRMVLPQSCESSQLGPSSFWFEARDGRGDTIYRRTMEDPTAHEQDVFEDDEIVQVSLECEDCFDVSIPDLPEIEQIVFFSTDDSEVDDLAQLEPLAVLDVR